MRDFPHAMLATATHDHKRGEDVRARLAVLSECAEEWDDVVRRWFALNAPSRGADLDSGDEYQLYQTLVGTWPADMNPANPDLHTYTERILQWREKSLREAKLRTSWMAPNRDFETENAEFVQAILDPVRSWRFLRSLVAFTSWVALAGACNSLVQCILRCTLPGVPDLYQGCEFWDLSLIDPDNRRPVDFDARRSALAAAEEPTALLPRWQDGRVKQALLLRLLSLRAGMPECFAAGSYAPLTVTGTRDDHVIAFERVHRSGRVLVAVPRLCARACAQNGMPNPSGEFWQDTAVIAPATSHVWRSALDRSKVFSPREEWICADLFSEFPGAILVSASGEGHR
jgi:(1->4)-alpha-D-glucan 1-alpha-D-glucosylmutase